MRFDWLLVKCASFFGQLNGTLTSSYTVLVRISNDLEQVGLRLARFLQEHEDTSEDDMNQAEAFSRLALVGNGSKKRNMLDCDLCNAFLFSFSLELCIHFPLSLDHFLLERNRDGMESKALNLAFA